MTPSIDPLVGTLMAAYADAVWIKDADAFLALFTEDARIFDLWTEWSYTGIEAWRTMVVSWFGGLDADRDRVTFSAIETVASADLAVVHALIRFTAVSSENVELRSMQERLTWTLRRDPGTDGPWRIAHQHTSVPVDPSDFKMIFRP